MASPSIRVLAEQARVYVAPSSVEGAPGETVSVEIRVENVERMAGIQLTLSFNRSVVNAENVTKGEFIKDFLFEESIDNEIGTVKIVAASAIGVNGSGVVAKIDFKLVGRINESTSLNIINLEICDEEGKLIPTTVNPGEIEVIPEFPTRLLLLTYILLTIVAVLARNGLAIKGFDENFKA
jgi:hypothetical protein